MPEKNLPAFLTVGEVAKRSGLAVSTLHFYETKNLISSVRTSGNQRRYARDVLRRISIIKTAQGLGISLADISALLEPFPLSKKPTARDVRKMISEWTDMLDKRIEGLTKLRNRIDKCIGCGCLSHADCPLTNPSDCLADRGPGAVLLF